MVTSRASFGSGKLGVLVHHAGQQRLVERSPVHADPDRLLILHRDFNHGAEVVVVLASYADVAGIDAVLGQAFGAAGILGEQEMSVVVEVADDGDADALLVETLDDVGDGFGGVVIVDGDSHHFAARFRQGGYLLDRAGDVGGVGIGHRLHHNWCSAADSHSADRGGDGLSASHFSHREALF